MNRTEQVLVLGTHNRKKGLEIEQLLIPFGLQLKTLADVPAAIEVDETGETFAANAALKATEQARHLGHWVLGEDSGLSVDALDGQPGVYSARYAGEQASDDANIDKLLAQLQAVPLEQRAAHYISHMCLSDPQGNVRAEAIGSCNGRIASERHGTAGFGYDPVFEVVEYHMTFGELGDRVKALLSHRGRASRRLLPKIGAILRAGGWQ